MVSRSSFSAESMSQCMYMLRAMGGMAKFTWNGTEFELNEKQGIKANDFKKIKRVIDDNADIIMKRWKDYFEN